MMKYGIYFLLMHKGMSYIQKDEEETKKRLEFVRIASHKLNLLVNSISDFELEKKIENVYDEIRNSQAVGVDKTQFVENEIINDIDALAILCQDLEMNRNSIIRNSDTIVQKIKNRNYMILMTHN